MKISFLARIRFRLFDIFKGTKVSSFLSLYIKSFSWAPEKRKEYQCDKLRELIIHAFENVPFYRARFQQNHLDPYTMKFPADMEMIPPLTREDIQNNLDTLISSKHFHQNIYKGSSSGSTGKPVVYYHDQSASSAGRAAGYFGWMLAGWRPGDKGLHIWGNPSAVNVQWKKLSSRIKSWLFRVDKYPAFTISEGGKLHEITSILQQKKYDYIDGYTNAIYLLSKYINDNNRIVNKVSRVLTTGENLHDYQRMEIERALGPVFDCYGCGEINGIAYENSYNKGYTIIEANVLVEFDKEFQGDDGAFPLIITHLHNYVMPLIRYKNGDMGIPDNTIGTGSQSLQSISGRVSDIIQLPNGGNLVVPSFFGSKLLRLISGIRQYQVIRTKPDEIEIVLAVDQKLEEKDEQILMKTLDDYLAGKINYKVVYTNKIAVNQNGKYKLLVDKLKI